MTPAIYRCPELADRIESLMSSPSEESTPDDRSFRFERVDVGSEPPVDDVSR
jgi:hypothetical protein